jgi:hypothetical protein
VAEDGSADGDAGRDPCEPGDGESQRRRPRVETHEEGDGKPASEERQRVAGKSAGAHAPVVREEADDREEDDRRSIAHGGGARGREEAHALLVAVQRGLGAVTPWLLR